MQTITDQASFNSLIAEYEGTTAGTYTVTELELIYRTRLAYTYRAEAERRPAHQIAALKKHRDKAFDNLQKAKTKKKPARLSKKK